LAQNLVKHWQKSQVFLQKRRIPLRITGQRSGCAASSPRQHSVPERAEPLLLHSSCILSSSSSRDRREGLLRRRGWSSSSSSSSSRGGWLLPQGGQAQQHALVCTGAREVSCSSGGGASSDVAGQRRVEEWRSRGGGGGGVAARSAARPVPELDAARQPALLQRSVALQRLRCLGEGLEHQQLQLGGSYAEAALARGGGGGGGLHAAALAFSGLDLSLVSFPQNAGQFGHFGGRFFS